MRQRLIATNAADSAYVSRPARSFERRAQHASLNPRRIGARIRPTTLSLAAGGTKASDAPLTHGFRKARGASAPSHDRGRLSAPA